MTMPDQIWAWEGNGGFLECNPTPIGPIEDSEKYIKAPVWRDIEELPEEWKDGRTIAIAFSDGENDFVTWDEIYVEFVCFNGDSFSADPSYFLDLDIPEIHTHAPVVGDDRCSSANKIYFPEENK